jgi:HEAT repeat protein
MENKPKLADILANLGDEEHIIDAVVIYGLSGLDSNQIAQMAKAWPGYSVERRRKLLQMLNEASESNFELDFRAINHMALDDPDGETRRYAIEGLWEDESIAYMQRLVDIVRNDNSHNVRAAAIIDLGRFILLGEYEDISRGDAKLAQNTVLNVFNSDKEDIEIRRRALEAISNCGHPRMREMIEEFYRHPDLPMKMSAIFAMGRTCDSDWAPEVLEELQSDIPELQYEAARAAGHLELKEAIPYIATLIDVIEDTEVLEVAIWALGEIGGKKARELLQDIINNAEADGNDEIVEAAEEAMEMASLPGDFLLFDFEP